METAASEWIVEASSTCRPTKDIRPSDRPSVSPSVHPTVRPSVRPSVRLSNAGHTRVIHGSYTGHSLVIYRSHTGHIRVMYVSYTGHIRLMRVTYGSCTGHVLDSDGMLHGFGGFYVQPCPRLSERGTAQRTTVINRNRAPFRTFLQMT